MNVFRPIMHRATVGTLPQTFCRHASLDTVIWQGIRRDAREEARAFDRPRHRASDDDYRPSPDHPDDDAAVPRIRQVDPYSDRSSGGGSPFSRPRVRRHIAKVDEGSDWIYGTNVVLAALKARRRTMHRLHIYAGANRTPDSRERDLAMKNLARRLKIDIREVADLGMLDSMSEGRPHNGYVLEASPLVKTPILSLGAVTRDRTTIQLHIAQHDITHSGLVLNALPRTIPNRDASRFPLVLMLDEILDPGNLGAILRTAYFLGCSALLVAQRNCAPLSPTCLKSSAGASEYLPLLTHAIPPRLIDASRAAGWKFFAAVPEPGRNRKRRAGGRYLALESDEVRDALRTAPTVLVMGGESDGLRRAVEAACDRLVTVRPAPDVDDGVDSLNVSVAAGVLCQAFLGRQPQP